MANLFYNFLGVIDNLTAIRQSVGDREHTLIRPFNQAILMWPTAVIGLFNFIAVRFVHWDEAAVGRVFLWFMFVNLLVLFFDLKFGKAVIILFSMVILGFILSRFDMLTSVTSFLGELNPEMNHTFYVLHSIIWAIIFTFVWMDRRSYVIVIEPNHVVVHDKWIGEAQSYPTENVTFSKEIGDALELMLGFGTLKIHNANNQQLIRAVPHVFRISNTLNDIKRVTAQFQVEHRSSSNGPT